MDANEVKAMLGENDIISLLQDLGAEPQLQGSNIECKTVCHHGSKRKLIYFGDSKTFRCFTDRCGSMDIFGLVGKVMDLDFPASFRYVCMKFGISYQGGTVETDKIDVSFFQKFKKQKETISIKVLSKSILNSYYDLYYKLWIEDGISTRSMKRFGIKYSILDNQIIIPHSDSAGNLIGVRARNLNEILVEQGKKYIPVFWKGEVLKHPTGAALYGLDLTREQIEQHKTIIIFESEKSVLQLDTMLPEMSIGVCLSGSSITNLQLELLKKLDINEVVVALDKEFEEIGSQEEKFYAEKVTNVFVNKLSPYFHVSVIWDQDKLLELKDSPTDKGLDTFLTLFQNRIFV